VFHCDSSQLPHSTKNFLLSLMFFWESIKYCMFLNFSNFLTNKLWWSRQWKAYCLAILGLAQLFFSSFFAHECTCLQTALHFCVAVKEHSYVWKGGKRNRRKFCLAAALREPESLQPCLPKPCNIIFVLLK